jgi:hypothetical protein
MAKSTTTLAPVEPIVAEEENLLESSTTDLVKALDTRGVIFDSCRESYQAIAVHGLDPKVLALRVTDSIIARDYAGREDSDLAKAARDKSVVEGGAKITGAAIKNRATAWALVLTVGVDHTPENVKQAFTLVSVGRGRTIASEFTEKVLPDYSEENDGDKSAWFSQKLEDMRVRMRATSPRLAANRNALTMEKVLAFLKEVPVQAWTEAQIATISDALQEADFALLNPAEDAE